MLKKCRCGTFKAAGDRWQVLRRAEVGEKSLLKCLRCGHKWHSRCQYVQTLRDHKEQCRSGMTDDDIIARIENGSLIVDQLGRFVRSQLRVTKDLAIWERTNKGSTYRFVSICHNGRKKKIAVHRLVWMAKHRTVVPVGFDVDHIEGRSIEHPDSIDNLRLLPQSVNRSRATDDFVTEECF